MSEQDRGAYTPQSDAPLTYDARRSGGGGGPAPMTLLVSGIILMALIVGLLIFYRHGMRHHGEPPQLVGAPIGQTKSPPPAEAGSGEPASGLQVYKAEATPSSETRAAPTFEAPPEQPTPLPAPRPQAAPPAVIGPAPLRGVVGAPPPAAPAQRPVVAAKAPAPKPAPVATAPVDVGNLAGSAFSGRAEPRPAAPAKPVVLASATPKPAPGAKPAVAAVATKPAPAKPATAAAPKAAPTKVAAPAPAAAFGGGTMVQIGAFSSAALAEKGWSDDAQVMPGKMAGKSRKVEAASKDGKTFYRAYVGGFATRADAAAFCSALKAKGKACFVK